MTTGGTMSDFVVGIDLGTTNSCLAIWENNQPVVLVNGLGNRTTPSLVAFTDDERLVGEVARSQQTRNTERTIFDAKRMIGRRYHEVQDDCRNWPFKVVPRDSSGHLAVELMIGGERTLVTPEEASAAILGHLRRAAEDYLGHCVSRAVVTVPANFNDSQRQATKDAGRIAGLTVERIINEPTAAAMAYGLDQLSNASHPSNLLIFDLGGGTLDVTVLCVDGGIFDVISTGGNTHLGGQDFDCRLADYFVSVFDAQYNVDLRKNAKAYTKLREKCRDLKHTLSNSSKADLDIDSLYEGMDFSTTITRTQFDRLNEDLYALCLEPVSRCLHDAHMSKEDIDEVVLVGGSTRIPAVQSLLSAYFGGKQLCKHINPDEAVAGGAAIQAANLSLSFEQKKGSILSNLALMDVTPLSLGIETEGKKMSTLIPRNTPVPYTHTRLYRNELDDQVVVKIEVFEGEEILTSNNRLLGSFELIGLPKRKRGEVKIEVTFTIDVNGILDVQARVTNATGDIFRSLRIAENKGLLTPSEVEKMAIGSQALELGGSRRKLRENIFHTLQEQASSLQQKLNIAMEKQPGTEVFRLAQRVIAVVAWLEEKDSSKASLEEMEQKRDELEAVEASILAQLQKVV